MGAVSKRLIDRDSLEREIEALAEETGAAYHHLGTQVQYSSRDYKLDVVVGMARPQSTTTSRGPGCGPTRRCSSSIRISRRALQYTLNHHHRSEEQILSDCLRSGIVHAQERTRKKMHERVAGADQSDLDPNPNGRSAESRDDDILV